MDETQIETAKTSSESLGYFPPHRRRHLRSETYRTLLRIFSQCYDDSFAARNLDGNLNTENGTVGLWQRTEEQGSQPIELVGGNGLAPKSSESERVTVINLGCNDNGSQDKWLSEKMMIDQIEQLMGFEEIDNLSIEKDMNQGLGPEQMMIDELEYIVKGNEHNVFEKNSKPLSSLLLQNQSCAGVVESSNGQGEQAEFQQIDVKKPVDASKTLSCLDGIVTGGSTSPRMNSADKHSLLNIDRQQDVVELNSASAIGSNGSTIPAFGDVNEEESHAQVICDDFNLCLGNNTVSDTLNSCNSKDDQRFPRTNELKVEHETQLRGIELEKSVCDGDMVDSANHMTEDIDMEDGEISGGYIMDGISMDMLLEDTDIQDKKVTEEPTYELSSETSFFLVNRFDNTNSLVGLKGSDRNKTIYTPENVHQDILRERACASESMLETLKVEKKGIDGNNNLVVHGNVLKEDATRENETCTEKNSEVRPKKKRGPSTKEKRAKKKEKERKKRAQKNRQLGVRRLKLHSIAKPKPKQVKYCRHYLYGRCQEGENCKFSHDVVPLTKSKPCCHFARHSCMKGDDCPFDHQLSKYPCSNFASRGFCSRGDDCMFSHKILPNEEAVTSTSAVEPHTKSASLIIDTRPQVQQNNESASKQTSSTLPFSALLQSRKKTDKSPNQTLLKKSEPIAKGTVGISPLADKLKQQNLFPNGDANAKAGKSGAVQSSNELPNRAPSVVTPKGINFLSFGRVQRDYLSGSKLASSASNGENGVKLSQLDTSASSSDSTLKGSPPLVAPKGINFLSFGRVQRDDLSGSKLASSSLNVDNGVKAKLSPLDNSNVPNQTSSASSSDLSLKGIQPVVAPKGINFHSLGVQRDDLTGRKLARFSSNGENGVQPSSLGNSNMPNQTGSVLFSDSTLKGIQPVVAPKGANFLSFGKASTDDSSCQGDAKLISECDNGTDSCVKMQQNPSDKSQQPSTFPLVLSSSTVSPIQPLDHSACRIYKESPHSAQKALFSTLAFAAKYECQTKSNQPTHDLEVGNEIANEPTKNGTIGGSQKSLAKTSKLLEFLSSIGSKSKQ